MPATDPRRMAVDSLFAQIVEVVSRPHESYAAFRAEVAARQLERVDAEFKDLEEG